MRGSGHVAVTPEHDDEIRPRAREHVPVVAEDGRIAQLGRPLSGERSVGIVNGDELRFGHTHERLEIRRVEQGMPVADADGCDSDGARHGFSRARFRG